jgi:hypothetical protein
VTSRNPNPLTESPWRIHITFLFSVTCVTFRNATPGIFSRLNGRAILAHGLGRPRGMAFVKFVVDALGRKVQEVEPLERRGNLIVMNRRFEWCEDETPRRKTRRVMAKVLEFPRYSR